MALPSYLIKQEQRSPSFRRSFLFRFAPSSSYLVWRFYEYMIQQLLEYRLEDWKWMQKFCEWAPEKWMNRAGGSGCDACRTAGATAQARIFFPFSGLAIPSGLGGGDGQPFYSSNFACFAFLQRSIISVILKPGTTFRARLMATFVYARTRTCSGCCYALWSEARGSPKASSKQCWNGDHWPHLLWRPDPLGHNLAIHRS